MNIYDALRMDGVRVSTGGRWLVLDGDTWTVMERKPGARTTTIIIETADEDAAVRAMLDMDEEGAAQ